MGLLLVKLQPTTLPQLKFLHGCFSSFLNSKNPTKSRKAFHITESQGSFIQLLLRV